MKLFAEWQFWAVGSAVFAAMTAILGKIGVESINSNFATLIRTAVVLGVLAAIVAGTGTYQSLGSVSRKTYLFLTLSGLATGASWLCYYRALKLGPASGVAPIDKMSVVLVTVFGALILSERLAIRGWIGVSMIAIGATLVAISSS
jgi:transporter family protein